MFGVLLAKTGLLVGFCLPADALLFTTGLLCTTTAASAVHLSLPAVLIAAAALQRCGTAKAIVLARFVPLVRTVLNPLAGAVSVPAGLVTVWQVISGLTWSVAVTLAGYTLGSRTPNIDRYLLPIVALVVAVSPRPGPARAAARPARP